ncbi:MAG: rRNA small subunit methyltransferase B [Actinobacteria bacterium]|nr:rRNA small subunit methyltransferase B [Actinomycetota bacterium]
MTPDDRRDARGRQRGAARASGRDERTRSTPAQRARSGDPARSAAFDTLRQVEGSDAYANLVLPGLLARRSITGRDAAFATELAYGTLRLRGRYDAVLALVVDRPLDQLDPAVLDLLRLGCHQLLGMRVPAHAGVSQTVALAREQAGTGSAQLVNAVLRKVAADDWPTWRSRLEQTSGQDETAVLAAVWSHPAWIVRALRQALVAQGRPGDDLSALLAADDEAPKVTLVARPGLVEPAELAAQAHGSVGRFAPTAVLLPTGDPGALAAVRAGLAGVQDEGSQLVALALAGAPIEGADSSWLDLCAGPGGKAALLGATAALRGARLVANEVAPHRAGLVEQAVRAVPTGVVQVRTGDGRALGEAQAQQYDRVLVDAPCTGLGALRRRPEARWRRQPGDLATLGDLQRGLLTSALAAVRPGGVVAYVTCSPHLAETRLVVDDVLRAAAKTGLDVERLDARAVVRAVTGGAGIDLGEGPGDVQLWPHVHGTDAMFLALLRRTS